MNNTSNQSSLFGRTRKLITGLLTGLATTGLLATALSAQAQGPVPLSLTSATPVTENFNGLGTALGTQVPKGFVVAFSTSTSPSVTYANPANTSVTTRVGGTSGTNAMNSSSAGGIYNFADGIAASATDRALGFLSSGSFAAPRHLLLAVQNNTGTTITDLAVAYDIEKYRSGTTAFEWQFFTSPDGITWTQDVAATEKYVDATTALVTPVYSITKNRVISGLNLPAGATTYLRWSYVGAGNTNTVGLGLDNLSITPTLSGSQPPAPVAAITTGSVSAASFCVTTTAGSPAFEVAYTSTGTFTGTYKVQLSDASGVFPASASSNIIGSGSSSPISATIPASTASGTQYRVRVLNDAPATTGSANSSDLSVSLTPATSTVTVSPSSAQTVPAAGSGAILTATAAAGSTFGWQYSTSPTESFTTIAGATTASYQLKATDFPGAGTYYLVAQATTATACGSVVGTSSPITVTVTAPAATPVVSVSQTTLPDFGSVAVGAGAPPKSFVVSGTSLTDNLTITPPAGFEIRTGTNPFACCSIVLSPVNGTVPNTTIDVRFTPTDAQPAQASIPVTGAGLPTQSVAVSGTGIAAVYPATLATTAVSNLTPTSVTTGGTIADDGGSAVTARGVVWSKTSNPVLGTTRTVDGAGSGEFNSAITGLLPGTTYYLRAYATNGTSTAYGDEVTFTTVAVPLATEPTAPAALTASAVTTTSLQLNLTGGNGTTKYLVVAHLAAPVDAEPTDATTYTADAAFGKGSVLGKGNYVVYNGTGSSVTVTNLRANTPYYFTVFAFNDNNTPYAENYLTTAPGTLTQTTEAAPIALLLEENFEYPVGSLLTANYWTAHSGAGTKSVAVVAKPLSYQGYSANSGNAAALTGSGEDVNRTFSPVYSRTPVYASFLVNVASVTTSGDYFFHLGPQVTGSTFRGRVFVRKDASNKLQFGVSSGSGTADYTPAQYDLNTTYLVVLKYTFDEAGSTAQLFINPTTTNQEPATASASATETGTLAAPNDNIGSVALRQGSASPVLTVDGIRVGNTYRVVRTGLTCLDPVLSVPTIATVSSTTDQCGASVAFAATATGAPAPAITYTIVKDGVVTPITSPYLFPVGTTTVTASAANACSTDTKTFTVTVEDKQAPTVLTQNLTVALSKGSATITAAQVDKASTDACGIASMSLDRTTFSCDNIGENTVTLTVTDIHGNTATATATVTVTGEIPKPTIAVTPGSNVFTGGVATTLYLGYGPKSATLTSTGGVAYSWSPAAGLSNANIANPVFTASQPGTFTYTVTVTSASGCTATQSVTLTVVDVRCGNKGNKVTVCHKGSAVCIEASDVADHLQHGDQLGDCVKSTSESSAVLAGVATQAAVFEAYPNPFTERTVIHFRAAKTGVAQLQVYNSLGQVVKTFYSGIAQSGQEYEFTLEGGSLTPGLYTGRLVLNGEVQTLRLMLNK
ncbi:T9SS type A sorting domain-containing protein [Hymenobacter wooponensis]|uniref:T9SS type A sorting domain-containing protein n=1 Tax=Hymenobacter wooponensis TaxID=1525360 RepID=A0A4Z0MU87_9BACT|nr:T9SS type A sorting domain-containing protein [Hymenobacter wooponensis]TGD83204.1 T9SS type A sorting domain-containing protein [Hymenobacter wooponensis]